MGSWRSGPKRAEQRACSVCEEPIKSGGARGLCAAHYKAARREADTALTSAKAARAALRQERREARVKEKAERRNVLRKWREGVARRAWEHSAEYAARLRPVSLDPERFDWTTAPSIVRALSNYPCRDCGAPPSWGVCTLCGAGVHEPVLPPEIQVVEEEALGEQVFTGRFAPVRKSSRPGRRVEGELVLNRRGWWEEEA